MWSLIHNALLLCALKRLFEEQPPGTAPRALLAADIIICTPEKWDGISRSWQVRRYVQGVGLIVIDEIHMLGADRGPTLEVIVSRMRLVAARTQQSVRFVGLSTALANAHDLAAWLGVGEQVCGADTPHTNPCMRTCLCIFSVQVISCHA